jgi:catechol 2,3-dioxygenase-like lactoylglutathione lyase family enzyme
MTAQLNHTIVFSKDNKAGATFLAEMLGLPAPVPFGPFMVVEAGNGVSLDYMTTTDDVAYAHYAFLISEEEFDQVFARIQEKNLEYWGDPHGQHPGEINHDDGGRGVYFHSPDGHHLEVITRPYGSGS